MGSLLSPVILTLAAMLALALPGVLGISVLFPAQAIRWRWITGATMALAAGVYLSVVLSYIDIRLFGLCWLALGAVFALRLARMPSRPAFVSWPTPTGWALLITLMLVGVSRVGAVTGRVVPMGWDPTFHAILMQKIILSQHAIHDWLPFEAIELNYPLGTHSLLAVMSMVTGVPPHEVFNVFLPLLGIFMTAEVYALGVAASRKRGIGLFAAIAFGFMGWCGSIGYASWGGLPNAMGMTLLICYLRLLLSKSFRGRGALMALLVASIILTHHHVMLTAAILLAATAAWAAATGRRQTVVTILGTGIAGSVLVGFHLLPYLMNGGEVAGTSAFHVFEDQEPLWTWLPRIGWCFCIMGTLGAVAYVGGRRRGGRSLRIAGLVPLVIGALVLLYAAGGIVYPALLKARGEAPFGAFTPSRFVADLVPFAAIYAAIPLYMTVVAWRVRLAVVMAVAIASTSLLWPEWRSMRGLDYPQQLVEAYAWVRANTPAETVVYADDWWAPYLCWRRTLKTNIPASEPHRFEEDERQLKAYLDAVLAEKMAPLSAGLQVVRVRAPGEAAKSDLVLARSPSGYVIELLFPKR